ncbi:ribulose-phosphate 3-epimerase-like isoform X2 [Gordionus sp. m RMFG-2023]|uniref:ribulose-phosphate 3-epimerase-like isoform X2 n=1 Tax=Gordionus sp. m RMFG-2023 TaxID=3053472 RepID=UPI0031FC03B6
MGTGPSILNSDLSNLTLECKRIMNDGADYIHLDVMDGHFVPNITFGHPIVKCLRQNLPQTPFDMHMMVSKPEKWINNMADAGAQLYTFHYEATSDPIKCIRKIRESGMKVGIGIKPKTQIDVLLPYVDLVDMVLVMTVEPGFGGQKFMPDMMSKVERLRSEFTKISIEVDGGIGLENIDMCTKAGANMIVSGTAIMKATDPQETISKMRAIADKPPHFQNNFQPIKLIYSHILLTKFEMLIL